MRTDLLGERVEFKDPDDGWTATGVVRAVYRERYGLMCAVEVVNEGKDRGKIVDVAVGALRVVGNERESPCPTPSPAHSPDFQPPFRVYSTAEESHRFRDPSGYQTIEEARARVEEAMKDPRFFMHEILDMNGRVVQSNGKAI